MQEHRRKSTSRFIEPITHVQPKQSWRHWQVSTTQLVVLAIGAAFSGFLWAVVL